MNGRSLTVLVLAVFLGLGAMLVTRRLMSKPAAAEEESQEILVAARDFKEEEILKPDMVKTARTNKSAVPVGAFSSFKDVEERWVKTTMLEGDPIVDKKLGPKGSPPGLVANIPKGMRAYTVDVTEQSGVSGFILPNHRVDVVRYEANEKSQLQRSETILQDILVLAAGQVFTRQEEKSLQNRTVTLAVFPEQVHILVAARAKGPLSLSLRGVNDHDIVDRPTPKPEESEEQKARRTKMEEELKARAGEGDEDGEGFRRAEARAGEEAGRAAPSSSDPEAAGTQGPGAALCLHLPAAPGQETGAGPGQRSARKVAQKKVDIDDDEPSSVGFGTTNVHQGRPRWQGYNRQ